jgi:hypothetical protein
MTAETAREWVFIGRDGSIRIESKTGRVLLESPDGRESVMTLDDLRRELEQVVPGATISIRRLPSGTAFADIKLAGRMLSSETSPRRGVGVSELTDDDSLVFAEHDRAFQTLEEAAAYVFSLLNIPRAAPTSRTAV